MAIIPPADFWPRPLVLNINGVATATAPLSVSSGNMTIADASVTERGVVNTAAQGFAGVKNFASGLSIAGGTTVTSVSTDGTFTAPTDAQVPTALAVDTLFNSIPADLITSVALPLYVTLGDLNIHDASALHDGVVTTAAQGFAGAKDFLDGFTAASGQVITDISTDTTFAAATDAQLSTALAVKTYVQSTAGFVTAATLPARVTAGNLSIDPASATAAGIVTTGSQTLAGAKTLTGQLTLLNAGQPQLIIGPDPLNRFKLSVAADGSTLIDPETGLAATFDIRHASQGPMRLYTNSPLALTMSVAYNAASFAVPLTATRLITQSTLDLNDPAGLTQPAVRAMQSKSLQMYCGTGAYSFTTTSMIETRPSVLAANLRLYAGSGAAIQCFTGIGSATDVLDIDTAALTTVLPTTITCAGPQLTLAFSAGNNTAFSVANTGDMTINSTGNDLNFHSSDRVHVLNNTASTSRTTGAFVVDGGIGVDGDIWGCCLNCEDVVGPQVHIGYSPAVYMELDMVNSGATTISMTGPTLTLAATPQVRVQNTTDATLPSNGSVHTDGGLSATKAIRSGSVVSATSSVDTARFNATTTINLPSIRFQDTTPTGACELGIITGGHTSLTTSGSLYINGVLYSPYTPYTTQNVTHDLAGAALGSTCVVRYQRDGTMVHAHFSALSVAPASGSSIAFLGTSLIPVTYRPTDDESNQLLVINQTVDMNDRGRYVALSNGNFIVYADAQQGNFAALATTVGWYAFTISWYKA